ncbi:Putative coenzyme F420-dependent oxidoreductase [bacterium HR24]|nr:Putative coenzyme F420-dependent oxidoreductase [bacterium HR24]
MRIGLFMLANRDAPALVERIARAEEEGFDGVWFGQVMGPDVMTVLALAGARTQRIELGTSVVPVQLRHPIFMAQQALVVNSATRGRLTLGLGPSHRVVVEGMWGLSYDRAAAYMREYLSVLRPLLHEGKVDFQGEFFRVNVSLQVPDARPCSVLVSALGPVMLRVAGELAEGTVTWMTGPRALETHVVPRLIRAAEAAGRPRPRVAVGLPIAVTSDPEAARQRAGQLFQFYNQLPSYRRMLDIEGAGGPQDVAIVGSEEEVERQLRRLAAIGTTDFLASVFPGGDGDDAQSMGRTREFLRSLVGKL